MSAAFIKRAWGGVSAILGTPPQGEGLIIESTPADEAEWRNFPAYLQPLLVQWGAESRIIEDDTFIRAPSGQILGLLYDGDGYYQFWSSEFPVRAFEISRWEEGILFEGLVASFLSGNSRVHRENASRGARWVWSFALPGGEIIEFKCSGNEWEHIKTPWEDAPTA